MVATKRQRSQCANLDRDARWIGCASSIRADRRAGADCVATRAQARLLGKFEAVSSHTRWPKLAGRICGGWSFPGRARQARRDRVAGLPVLREPDPDHRPCHWRDTANRRTAADEHDPLAVTGWESSQLLSQSLPRAWG